MNNILIEKWLTKQPGDPQNVWHNNYTYIHISDDSSTANSVCTCCTAEELSEVGSWSQDTNFSHLWVVNSSTGTNPHTTTTTVAAPAYKAWKTFTYCTNTISTNQRVWIWKQWYRSECYSGTGEQVQCLWISWHHSCKAKASPSPWTSKERHAWPFPPKMFPGITARK